jgi:hypothetical protein
MMHSAIDIQALTTMLAHSQHAFGLLEEHARPLEMVQHVKHRDIVETSSSEGQALRIG